MVICEFVCIQVEEPASAAREAACLRAPEGAADTPGRRAMVLCISFKAILPTAGTARWHQEHAVNTKAGDRREVEPPGKQRVQLIRVLRCRPRQPASSRACVETSSWPRRRPR